MEGQDNNIILHKPCIERIEEMYTQNKDFYKLYQDELQKNIYTDTLNKKLMIKIKKNDDKIKQMDNFFKEFKIGGYNTLINIVKSYKSHKCKCDCIINTSTKVNDKSNENTNINIYEHHDFIKLKSELESLKNKQYNKEQDIYDNIREELKNEFKEELDRLRDEKENISINNNSKIDNLSKLLDDTNKNILEIQDIHKKQMEDLKIEYENKLNKKEKPLPTPSNSTESNINKKEIDYNCKVTLYNDNSNKTRIKCAEKTYILVKYYYELLETSKKDSNENFDALNDTAEYLYKKHIEENNKEIKKESKKNYINKWKRIVNRCHKLYEKFNKDLKVVHFSLDELRYVADYNWDKWKEYLNNKINMNYESVSSEKKIIINNLDNKFLPYGTIYKGYHGQDKKSKGPCEIEDCPNEKRNTYNKYCKTCYKYFKSMNENIDDSYNKEEIIKIDKMVNNNKFKNKYKNDNLCNICFQNEIDDKDNGCCNECYNNLK